MMKFGLKRQLNDWNFNAQSYMWTLGTNVRFKRWYGPIDLPEDWEEREKPNKKGVVKRVPLPKWGEAKMKWQDNSSTIIALWQKFTTRLKVNRKRKGIPFRPLVYVVEAGKPCRYSPCVDFLGDCENHGEKLHIHWLHQGKLSHKYVMDIWRGLTGQNSNVNFTKVNSIGYLAKYISKSLIKYSFLGEFYHAHLPPKQRKICGECYSRYEFGENGVYRTDFKDDERTDTFLDAYNKLPEDQNSLSHK